MLFEKFIEPKQMKIGEHTYTISQIPAVDALGICNAVSDAVAKNGLIGITMLPIATDRKILSYTALSDMVNIVPETDQLFNDIFKGGIGDAKRLVVEMVKYNFGFLTSGDLLNALVEMPEATDSAS